MDRPIFDLNHIIDTYRPHIEQVIETVLQRGRIRILVVVDPEISLMTGPSAFGVGRVVELIRGATVGFNWFEVVLARRGPGPAVVVPSPGPSEPRYESFRFDMEEEGELVLDRFHEVWCFGFKPGNDDGPDTNIENAGAFPMTNDELAALTRWMNERQGGVFATGDHDYLGASMCHRIPRVGTMRMWTNAQGVPPIGGPDRIDTNQPATPGQADIGGMPDEMPNSNQSDAVPQRIEWVTWMSRWAGFARIARRPHPVLCHPTLGPIDVMPDHPHEGRCFDTMPRPGAGAEIDVSGSYTFAGYAGAEYPEVAGRRPLPTVIAYGNTLPSPPYDYEKGESPAKRFPMISVYDGQTIGYGRVAVDSTWHHWMDLNLEGLRTAADTTAWQKVARYFINLAIWLAPARTRRPAWAFALYTLHFEYIGMREFSPRAGTIDLGKALLYRLRPSLGQCWVTEWLLDILVELRPTLRDRILDKYVDVALPKRPRPEPCLSCPPWDLVEQHMLGGMVRATLDRATQIREAIETDRRAVIALDLDELEREIGAGLLQGAAELDQLWQRQLRSARPLVAELRAT